MFDRRQVNNIEHLTGVATQLHVSPIALAWRLYNLKWINVETLNTLKEERQRNLTLVKPKRFSPTFVNMLYNSIDCGRLSAKKLRKRWIWIYLNFLIYFPNIHYMHLLSCKRLTNMTKTKVYVDTNVILEAFRINCWSAICQNFAIETLPGYTRMDIIQVF